MSGRIYLSPPHLVGTEEALVRAVFESNWIAPLGPQVDAFQEEFAAAVDGGTRALALSSGTAALHLALQLVGVGHGDEVFVSSMTFAATVYPIRYLGAKPVFVDSERQSWNADPDLLVEALDTRARANRLPKAVVLVHVYGQSANVDPVVEACRRHGVPLIEDAAEALGATYKGRAPGTFGHAGIFSFNGNKIVTTSGGGMLVSRDRDLLGHALKLATQARDAAPHYEHSEVGYNYRMSNVLAAIGRAQLSALPQRVQARRRNFAYYEKHLGDLPGLDFQPEAPWGTHSRWLTTLTVDPETFGVDREAIRLNLEKDDIESRPVWKPMHLQPVFSGCESIRGDVAADLFNRGLCLPSGSNLTEADLERVVGRIRELHARAARSAPLAVGDA